MKRKIEPRVYAALRDSGYSNRRIAELLNVDESSVRRGLRATGYVEPTRVRRVLAELADAIESR